MSTQFSAGPQALGYLYQARYSLFALLNDNREEAAVVLEGLDDIVVEGQNFIKLDQLKHHVSKSAALTDKSPDLWKTLRVWSTALEQGTWQPENVSLNLITTAEAGKDSVASFLCRDESRDERRAYEKLVEIANEASNEKLTDSFEAFKSLRPTQQKRMIASITVIDASPNILDIAPLIKKKLGMSTDRENIDSLYERLEGWWFDKVAAHLISYSSIPITQLDLYDKIVSIAEQLKRTSLPIDYLYAEPSDDYYDSNDEMLFVHQLKHLKLNTKRIRNSVLDYYKAFEQRSRWARETLYIDDELINFEKRLTNEWERYLAILQDDLGILDFEDDQVCVTFGRQLLSWMETHALDLPIRASMPLGHEYVTRGSYHMLANLRPPHVYWHPKFIDYLNEILSTE